MSASLARAFQQCEGRNLTDPELRYWQCRLLAEVADQLKRIADYVDPDNAEGKEQ
jgi:hypothetical protein